MTRTLRAGTPPEITADAFEDLPHAEQVLGTLQFASEDLTREWARLVRRLTIFKFTAPARTTSEPLWSWCETHRVALESCSPSSLVNAGVAVPDLVRLDQAGPKPYGPGWLTTDLTTGLFPAVEDVAPDLSVRAAIAWAMVANERENGAPIALLREWIKVGLGEIGWMFAAAGFSPAEVNGGLDAGTVTSKDALMLASLRGAALPV
jgi:hypothetical protein